jgi:hypothetical protein
MFKRFLFLAVSVATTSAVDYRVDEYYTDSACTTRATQPTYFSKVGCFCGVKDTKVAGGYESTYYDSDNHCTGTVIQGIGGFVADSSCSDTGVGLYVTTSWKTSLPVTAADIPEGKLLVQDVIDCVATCDKTTETYRGKIFDMDTCLFKGEKVRYAGEYGLVAGEYKLTRNPSKPTEILRIPNCTVPGTPVVEYILNQCRPPRLPPGSRQVAILGGVTELSGAASTASLCTLLALLSVMTSFVLA